jgi:hypothetical protein
MLKRCIFTISDLDTGEIYGRFDHEYNISEKRDKDFVVKILQRFVEIPVQKNCNVTCSFTVRPPKDSVQPLDIF